MCTCVPLGSVTWSSGGVSVKVEDSGGASFVGMAVQRRPPTPETQLREPVANPGVAVTPTSSHQKCGPS